MQNLTTIDCQYVEPKFAAAYLIREQDRGLFIENNTAKSVPLLLKALELNQLRPEQIDYLIVTHVHLDHAGGTSVLIKACQNAIVLAHPRAAPHIIDPSRLVKSARQVYGTALFDQLYGTVEPVNSERVRVMGDGEKLQFGSRELQFFYTRGHANHHFCIFDSLTGGVFTGDSFGLAYPTLQSQGPFIFPSTSPTDFDPVEARISIKKILGFQPRRLYLTHFGEIDWIQEASSQLLRRIDFSEELLEQAISCDQSDEMLDHFCELKLQTYYKTLVPPGKFAFIQPDLKLNAAGIAHVAKKRRSKNLP